MVCFSWSRHGAFNLAEEDRREAIKAYLACVAFVDEQVGHILDQLESSGQLDNTLIILSADHGFQLGEHGLWFKNFCYQESTHIPLIISDPQRTAGHGQHCAALVDQTDVFPTVMDCLGITNAPAVEGRSLQQCLDDPGRSHRAYLHTMVNWGAVQGQCIRTHDYAYTQWTGVENDQEQLFDLQEDPGEHYNLLHNGQRHAAQAELAQLLQA